MASAKGLRDFIAGAVVGLVVALLWNNVLGRPGQIDGLVFGVFANLAVFSLMPRAKTADVRVAAE